MNQFRTKISCRLHRYTVIYGGIQIVHAFDVSFANREIFSGHRLLRQSILHKSFVVNSYLKYFDCELTNLLVMVRLLQHETSADNPLAVRMIIFLRFIANTLRI